MLDKAFEALKTYDLGEDKDREVLNPIEEAVIATHGDADARKTLETRLAAVLKTDAPFTAKQYVCRKLMVIGTAVSVPTLAGLLGNAKMAHSARYALERIVAPEAGATLRDALSTTKGDLKIGVIGSLGARGEAANVAPLADLLGNGDAAIALGAIRSSAAAKALAGGKKTNSAVSDALLACAESILAGGKKAEAKKIYQGLIAGQPKHVKLAATRGMLACAAK